MQINFISILEYIGIISFAASGAYVAMGKRMDIFGVLVVATVTALGGGILRDVIMDVGVPIFFRSYVSILLVLMTAAAVMLLGDRLRTLLLIPLFDTLGLAVFAIDTGVKAIQSGYSLTEFAFVSVITAVSIVPAGAGDPPAGNLCAGSPFGHGGSLVPPSLYRADARGIPLDGPDCSGAPGVRLF